MIKFDNSYGELEEFEDQPDTTLVVGIVGHITTEANLGIITDELEDEIAALEEEFILNGDYDEMVVVSGLKNHGVPKLAYEVADMFGVKTVGFVPEQAKDFEHYPVDEIAVVGDVFGDESESFIEYIDIFVKIGSDDQSEKELELAVEEELPIIEIDI